MTCPFHASEGQATPPDEPFVDIEAGSFHTCGHRADETVVCWGLNDIGQTDAPNGSFVAIRAGYAHTCGLRSDKSMKCWGAVNPTGSPREELPGDFEEISCGTEFTCGKHPDGTLSCGMIDPAPQGDYRTVVAGGHHACAIAPDLKAVCWGVGEPWDVNDPRFPTNFGQSIPPAVTLRQLSLGLWHSCGMTEGGAAECWGRDQEGQADVPADFP